MEYQEYTNDEQSRQYLDFLQANITRMNQCSMQTKGWCIALLAALLAVFASNSTAQSSWCVMGASGSIVSIAFAFLDAYYLRFEKQFRSLYNAAIKDMRNNPDMTCSREIAYCLDPNCVKGESESSIWHSLRSKSVLLFYFLIMVAFLIVVVLPVFICK